jgi:hypothetical protein
MFSSQHIPSQPLADDLTDGQVEPFAVVQVSIVEPESLLVQIPEQVEWFNAHICAVQPALQETPEVLHPISVNIATNIFNRMVNNSMLEFAQAIVGLQGIGIQRGPGLNVLSDFGLQGFLPAILHYRSAHLAGFSVLSTLKDSHAT